MSKYKVKNRFVEKTHDNHVYEVGDGYPAKGKKLVKSRAEFLTKTHPQYGVAFLEEVVEKTVDEDLVDESADEVKDAEKSDA